MNIDREEARRVAGLAHLEFDDAGLDRMASEMTRILTYIDQLREAGDGSSSEFLGVPRSSSEGEEAAPEELRGTRGTGGTGATPLRDDEPRPSLDRDAVARNAPAWRDGLFVVPKVIGGE